MQPLVCKVCGYFQFHVCEHSGQWQSKFSGARVLLQFVLRSEVLRLYRDMLRVVKRGPSVEQQAELRQWIRTDFDNNKHHTDEVTFHGVVLGG